MERDTPRDTGRRNVDGLAARRRQTDDHVGGGRKRSSGDGRQAKRRNGEVLGAHRARTAPRPLPLSPTSAAFARPAEPSGRPTRGPPDRAAAARALRAALASQSVDSSPSSPSPSRRKSRIPPTSTV